ncbi:site-specific integrase [Bacillus sonorensis]|uniref:Integrase n=2 Tax=Bacillus TaxID=1386 RepID=A0A0T6BNF5_9BACI|nr:MULTISPECIES: site-specific integrase [Bacillus]EME72278.1 phage integrase [Bacillus sonorensis L12]KKB71970.1 integrase [Bacillus sp. TH008]KRT92726.1 integrase [Bacillus glycinifermentans]MCZ0075396.1 site-specific integrase [Bacillus sonorensis]MCZ0093051.1 site-specific integrase [Bacillus sonorensis]
MGAEVKPIREYSVFNDILTYLREKDTESLAGNVKGFDRKQKKKSKYGLQSNTAINYLGDIKQFFRFYCKTEIEFLKEEHLSFKRSDVLAFKHHLAQKGLANTTINRKIAALKSLHSELKRLYPEFVDDDAFYKIKRSPEIKRTRANTSQIQAEMICENMFIYEKQKPLLKKLFGGFLLRSSFRISAALYVRWCDFEVSAENPDWFRVTVIDKGAKLRTTGIHRVFYEQLLALRSEETKDTDRVFEGLSEDAFRESLKRALKRLGIPEEKGIVPHSFRGVGITEVFEATGKDYRAAMKQADHSRFDTTLRYLNDNKDISQTAGIIMDEELDVSILKDITKEEFLRFFEQCDKQTLRKALHFFAVKPL